MALFLFAFWCDKINLDNCRDYVSKYFAFHNRLCASCDLRYPPSLLFAMSTPPNNERSPPRKWITQKFRSLVSSSRSQSRNLEVRSTSINAPPINSDRSGMKIGLFHKYKGLNIPRRIPFYTWRASLSEYYRECYEYRYDIIQRCG